MENNLQEQKNKIKKMLITTIIIVALITVLGIALKIKNNAEMEKYNYALELKNSGKYEEAYEIFYELNGFENSEKMMEEIIKDYPYLMSSYEPLTTFFLGEYEQDNNLENGKEPIEWIVLENKNGAIYAISKYVLDAQPFNTKETNDCTLDTWLDMTFRNNAFQAVPADVVTRVELLDEDYFSEKSIIPYDKENIIEMTEYTAYALTRDEYAYFWWVMPNDMEFETAPVVFTESYLIKRQKQNYYSKYHSGGVTDIAGVRPAIWLFAKNLPKKPVYSGESYNGGSNYSGGKCAVCNGTGYVKYYYGSSDLEAWLTGHDAYTVGKCQSCNGTGKD